MSLHILHDRLAVAGNMLSDGESAITEACACLLLSMSDVLDLPPGTAFYEGNIEQARALSQKAARAAMAVLLSDNRVSLPAHIETAYDMPEVV